MIQTKEKACKGTGLAKGYGCGVKTKHRTYGLGKMCCFPNWLLTSENGKIILAKAQIKGTNIVKKKEKVAWRKKKSDFNTSGAMELADTYFSRFIRLFFSVDGKCTCYTCGNIKLIKEVDNGHYQKREHKATRYDVNNCRPQCKTCNGDTKHNGKQIEFRENLVNEIGEDAVLEVERLARTTVKANTVFYRTISDEFRNKVNELQKKLKVKYW